MIRLAAVAAAAGLVLAGSACGDENEPSPQLAEDYDIVIAVCEERLQETTDVCERFTSSPADLVYANVIFGNAGGSDVTVRTETVSGGPEMVDEPPAEAVPEGRSWLHVVELPRDAACTEPECELEITAVVDGRDVANQRFTFTGP